MSVVIPHIPGLEDTFPCPATVYLPGHMGALVAHQFVVHFKRLDTEARNALSERHIAGEVSVQGVLDEVVAGWGGMLDAHKNPVEYSHEVRVATDKVYAGVEHAMALSWFNYAFINQRAAAEKNSKALSGTGTA